jgi:hypothetical protein
MSFSQQNVQPPYVTARFKPPYGGFLFLGFTDRFIVHFRLYNQDITAKEANLMNYKIRYSNGHVEVMDSEGNFLFSADSEYEATQELKEIEAA